MGEVGITGLEISHNVFNMPRESIPNAAISVMWSRGTLLDILSTIVSARSKVLEIDFGLYVGSI